MIMIPATIAMSPARRAGRSGSPSIATAIATANSGARLPSVPVTTGPSRRLASKVSSVTTPGNRSPTAAKIGTAAQEAMPSASTIGAAHIISRVDDGMLTAAPASGERSRKPSCVNSSAAPKQNADASARAMAMLVMRGR
jgi:hypothetical protein